MSNLSFAPIVTPTSKRNLTQSKLGFGARKSKLDEDDSSVDSAFELPKPTSSKKKLPKSKKVKARPRPKKKSKISADKHLSSSPVITSPSRPSDDENHLLKTAPPVITLYPEADKNIAQPGDLVMSTAKNIHHPAVRYRSINPAYLILGVVKSYTYVKWVTPKGTSDWAGYKNNHERLVVEWQTVDAVSTGQRYVDTNHPSPPPLFNNPSLVDFYVDIPPAHVDNLNVVCKRNSANIEGLNDYMKAEIVKAFVWDVDYGWRHI